MKCVKMEKFRYNSIYILISQNKIKATWRVVRRETEHIKNKPVFHYLLANNTVSTDKKEEPCSMNSHFINIC